MKIQHTSRVASFWEIILHFSRDQGEDTPWGIRTSTRHSCRSLRTIFGKRARSNSSGLLSPHVLRGFESLTDEFYYSWRSARFSEAMLQRPYCPYQSSRYDFEFRIISEAKQRTILRMGLTATISKNDGSGFANLRLGNSVIWKKTPLPVES